MKNLVLFFLVSSLLIACSTKDCEKYNSGTLRIENKTTYNCQYVCGVTDFIGAGETVEISVPEGANSFTASITAGQGATNTWSSNFTINSCEEKAVKLEN